MPGVTARGTAEALEAAASLERRLDELVRAYLRAWKMP